VCQMTQFQRVLHILQEVLHLPKLKRMISSALFVRLGTKGIRNVIIEIDCNHVEEAVNNSRQCQNELGFIVKIATLE